MNHIFFERTKDGEIFYDLGSKLAQERIIILSEEIDEEVAATIVPLLFLMDNKNHDPISLWINSPGGDVFAFFAIYDIMKLIKSPVHTYCVGSASSAAAMLLSSGDKRFCTPNSSVMIHEVSIDAIGGTNSAVENEAKEMKKINDRLAELLARNTGKTVSRIKKDIKYDHYMTAEEAVKYGIVDSILKPTKIVPELKKIVRKRKKKEPSEENKSVVKPEKSKGSKSQQ